MRIGIDARFLTHPQSGGFKTYTENLIAALTEIDTENEFILYLDRPPEQQVACTCAFESCELSWVRKLSTTARGGSTPTTSGEDTAPSRTPLAPRANVTLKVVPGRLPVLGMPWREQVTLARQIAADRLDLFHAPCLTAPLVLPCPSVVTIHDIIWLFPSKFSKSNSWSAQRKLMEWYYLLIPQYAAKRASMVITVSQAAKQSIVDNLKLDSNRIIVTHEAPSQCFRKTEDVRSVEFVRRKYNLDSSFIFGIGSSDPRKNIQTLVQAYALLPSNVREKNLLVINWTHEFLSAELTGQIESLGLTDRVRFLQHVSNEDMMLVYNAASLFVLPSRYEGFGLPLLEAMTCGTPVIAANNSSIPEVVGDAALLFDTEDAQSLANQIEVVLTDESLRANLTARGAERVHHFSWRHCARQTMTAYEQARLENFTARKVSVS